MRLRTCAKLIRNGVSVLYLVDLETAKQFGYSWALAHHRLVSVGGNIPVCLNKTIESL